MNDPDSYQKIDAQKVVSLVFAFNHEEPDEYTKTSTLNRILEQIEKNATNGYGGITIDKDFLTKEKKMSDFKYQQLTQYVFAELMKLGFYVKKVDDDFDPYSYSFERYEISATPFEELHYHKKSFWRKMIDLDWLPI